MNMICRNICAGLLLAFALGCNQHQPANKASTQSDSNVAPAVQAVARTNDDETNRLPAATKAVTTEGDARSNLLAVWRSTNSTPEEVVNALMKWMPRDTTIVSAPNLLGRNSEMSHSFGPSFANFDSKGPTNSWVDYFELTYQLSRGVVALRFSKHGDSSDVYFEKAYVSEGKRIRDVLK